MELLIKLIIINNAIFSILVFSLHRSIGLDISFQFTQEYRTRSNPEAFSSTFVEVSSRTCVQDYSTILKFNLKNLLVPLLEKRRKEGRRRQF